MKEKVSLVKACSIGDEMAGFYYNQGKTDSAENYSKSKYKSTTPVHLVI